MASVLQRWLPLALLVVLALVLRVAELDRRPMHADEANQAVKTGELLEGRGYAFDPSDHHGPTLYYAALPIAWFRGERSLATLTETSLRLIPALAGTAAVLLLYALALPLGRWPALAAAAFLAVSPPAVYYSRTFIQETLLLAFTLGALVCGHRWWTSGRLPWAIAAGICAGLMQATKASAPLFLVAALIGLTLARPIRPVSARPGRDLGLALLAAAVCAGLFYSSFGTNPRGVAGAFSTYAAFGQRLTGETGHEKPFWYYFSLFGWQKKDGVVTHQLLFSLLALGGLVVALFSRTRPLLRWTLGYTVTVTLVLSLTAYKTPWHAIHLAPGFALLAAGLLVSLPARLTGRVLATSLAGVAVAAQAAQVRLTSFQRPADERNPYAYVHTSPDVRRIPALAARVAPGELIRVISEEVWPLPWYLRDRTDVGYWTTPPDDCDAALVIASAGFSEEVQSRLRGRYTTGYVGLRPGFVLVTFTRQP